MLKALNNIARRLDQVRRSTLPFDEASSISSLNVTKDEERVALLARSPSSVVMHLAARSDFAPLLTKEHKATIAQMQQRRETFHRDPITSNPYKERLPPVIRVDPLCR